MSISRPLLQIAIGLVVLLFAPISTAVEETVGSTVASFGASQNGAASYSIPIRATEGIAGLTPALSIDYAGPGARTVLGVGFALGGLSTITPCRKTIAQDLNAAPILLTSGDRYCLDGVRLRVVSGTYGATGSTYRTEIDQLARVTANASTSNIPGWFKVETRDGLIYEYGNRVDAKLLAGPSSGYPPQFWAVNKIYDRAGNSVEFYYDKDDAQRRFRPNYILYTAGNGGSAKYRISFIYQSADRPDVTLDITPSSFGGATHTESRLLDRIELLHDGVAYRKYKFAYETGAGSNSRLKTVQECATTPSEVCFPATTLSWQSVTPGHDEPVSSGSVANGKPLDINGDGFEDLVWASGTWRYMLGGANGYSAVYNTGLAATNQHRAMPLDWNGDGLEDLLIDWSDGKWRVLRGSLVGAGSGLRLHEGIRLIGPTTSRLQR